MDDKKNEDNKSDESLNVDELENLRSELKSEKELKLRALADFDNYRKRVEMERTEAFKQAVTSVLREVADVIDDFERMIQDLDQPDQEDKIDAFKPVLGKLKGIMVDNMLNEITVNPGDSFSPSTMEAIGTTEVEDENQHNKVVHVTQKGYQFQGNDNRILRHARVIVGKHS